MAARVNSLGQTAGHFRPRRPRRLRTGATAAALALLCRTPTLPAGDERRPGVFAEKAAASGLVFQHESGARGEYRFPEIVGSGVALLDFDRDGDLDVYLVQGAPSGGGPSAGAAEAPSSAPPAVVTDRLFRNELLRPGSPSPGRLVFTDATAGAELHEEERGAGMGVAAGDYDGDGWTDLYLTRSGSNRLLRNLGDGSFEDVTTAAGADDPRWSVPAVFFDYDRDGRLDLWIGNYSDYREATHKRCVSATGAPDYCAPQSYGTVGGRLLRNRGDGSFVETTLQAGMADATSYMLGAIPLDFDGDGWLDLYVANDSLPNHLWRNLGDGTFREVGLLYGCAVNEEGEPEASMGVDAGDYDGDGDLDLFMTHLDGETNTLYRNEGGEGCTDATRTSGLGEPSFDRTGFGTAWLDFDNDGRLDLFVTNGAVRAIAAQALSGDERPYHQRPQLFRNLGDGRFGDASAEGGAYFEVSEIGRGAAFGDLDNDGDTDIVVSTSGGPARLLLNQLGQDRSWIGLELYERSGRAALGSRAGVFAGGDRPLWRVVRVAGSYASSNDPRLLFGLGERTASSVERVEVWWPDGSKEEWREVPTRRYTRLVQGTGTAVRSGAS